MTEADTVTDEHDAPSPPRYVIVGGGEPTAEQLAALTVALTPVAGPGPARRSRDTGGWSRAALLEGLGGRPAYGAADVERLR